MGLSGFAEIPDRSICFETGLNQGELEECKKELQEKVRFFNDWVYVINLMKYDPIIGEKNNLWIAFQKELALVPTDIRSILEGKSYPPSEPLGSPSPGTIGIGNGIGIGKEGVVGETKPPESSPDYLLSLPEQDIHSFHEAFPSLDSMAISVEASSAYSWLKANGKAKQDYKHFLRNWLRKTHEQRLSPAIRSINKFAVTQI